MTKVTKKLAVAEKNISTQVLGKIEQFQSSGEIQIPADYSPANALKSAYLVLAETQNASKQFALQHCSNESIANALLKMVVNGLSVMKQQCDLIMYGDKLECVIEYTGNIVLAKRYGDLKYIKGNAIFKGDEFDFEVDTKTGLKTVVKHKQTLESLGNKIILGAYAVYELTDGRLDTEIMNITQIKDSWEQGGAKGKSKAHTKFPDQMAIKTVINRACKLLIRGSNDNILFAPSPRDIDVTQADMEHTIQTDANKEEITIDIDAVPVEEKAEEIVEKAPPIAKKPEKVKSTRKIKEEPKVEGEQVKAPF